MNSQRNYVSVSVHKGKDLLSAVLIIILVFSIATLALPQGYESTITQYPLPWNPWKAPYGLKVDSSGIIWFTESQDGNAIGRFNPFTKTYTEFMIPTPAAHPYDLEVAAGKVWFTESSGNKVGVLDPATGAITEFPIPTPNSYPYGIRVDNQGNIWFAEFNANKIGRLTAGIITEYTTGATSGTHYLAPDSQGLIWFARSGSSGVISVLNPQTGVVTEFMPPTVTNTPTGILVDPLGFVWFTEYGANKIARFNPATRLFQEFPIPYQPGDPPNPWQLTTAPDGSIWFSGDQQFSSTGTGVVGRIDPNSGMVSIYKIPKPPLGGTLQNHPKGIGADQFGNIWVALWDTDYLAQLQYSPTTVTAAFTAAIRAGTSVTFQSTATSSGASVSGATVTVIGATSVFTTGTSTSWVATTATTESVTKSSAAWVSGTYLVATPVSGALSSGPGGDQSTVSATFTSTLQSIVLTADGSTTYLAIGTSQLWDSLSTAGASMAVCRDGTRISGDMYSVGATITHRHLATAIALDKPSAGSHTYSLCFKTDNSAAAASVSGTYIVVFPATGALSSGPTGDQSTTSTTFSPSAESIPVTTSGSQQYMLLAASELWDSLSTAGASMAVCRDGTRISGDMYSVGATITHRHLATALALDTAPSGAHTYTLCFKTDTPGSGAFVSGTYLVAVPAQGAIGSGPHGDQSTTSTGFIPSAESTTISPSPTQTYLILATSQLWDVSPIAGPSMAVCRDGTRISGDMYSAGALQTHRHLASAMALDTTNGNIQYTLCFKTASGF